MKKIIFRFWLINILISVVLFILYRIVIASINQADGNFFETVFQILDTLLNVAYSFIYIIAIVFCSLTIFLNLIVQIRNNFYLSLLTFLGIPLFCVIFMASVVLTDKVLYHETAIGSLLNFSFLYLLVTAVQFLMFRKRVIASRVETVTDL